MYDVYVIFKSGEELNLNAKNIEFSKDGSVFKLTPSDDPIDYILGYLDKGAVAAVYYRKQED